MTDDIEKLKLKIAKLEKQIRLLIDEKIPDLDIKLLSSIKLKERLTGMEKRIFETIKLHTEDNVISREELSMRLFGYYDYYDKKIPVHVSKIKRKVAHLGWIGYYREQGYYFVPKGLGSDDRRGD